MVRVNSSLMQVTLMRAGGLASVLLLAGSLLGACNTAAVGIEECREIEAARCEASVPCGILTADEVQECQRFYEDQCLHGIAGPKEPTADQQIRCVDLIEASGEAAKMAQESMNNDDLSVSDFEAVEADYDAACAIVSRPWDESECSYLAPESEGMGGADTGEE